MDRNTGECLVCGKVHRYVWDYVICEQDLLNEEIIEIRGSLLMEELREFLEPNRQPREEDK
jgi:hypothetical protein